MEYIFYVFYTSLLTSIVWFVVGGAYYMNPWISGIYKKLEGNSGMKTWGSKKKWLVNTFFLGGWLPILLLTLVYMYLFPLHPFAFALIIFFVRIVPRFVDAWIQTSYPSRLLWVEFFGGLILSFVTSYSLVFFMAI